MGKQTAKRPIAVVTSDVHFNINTLEVASKALRLAVDKANSLKVSLIIAGDLHDTKAHLRGECVKAMLSILNEALYGVYVIRGNHDSIHEKATEHSLEFLRPFAVIVDKMPAYLTDPTLLLVPYYHDVNELRAVLATRAQVHTVWHDPIIIMHQGLNGSEAGEYIQDKSALNYEDVADYTVVSGHYHRRQTIDTGKGRTFSYIGNPYTLGFGEAEDPEKGFQVLYSDGSLEFVPTNLRKHIKVSVHTDNSPIFLENLSPEDIILVKLHGSSDDLSQVDKKEVGHTLGITQSFRLDLIPDDVTVSQDEPEVKPVSNSEVLDAIIDSLTNTDDERKKRLKKTWKELI